MWVFFPIFSSRWIGHHPPGMSQVWVEVSHQNLATFAPLFLNALCHHGAKVHHKRKHYSWDGRETQFSNGLLHGFCTQEHFFLVCLYY
jgi:hypothetical protein